MLLACHGPLYRYARTLSRDPQTAEDLVQETYRRALVARSVPFPATEEVLRPWLFTIARNHWRNELRKARVMDADEGVELAVAPDAVGPEAALSRRLLQSEVRDAVDGLPDLLREVIVLREMENMSYEQIADFLQCPVGTVMSRLFRARMTLRQALGHHGRSREGVRR